MSDWTVVAEETVGSSGTPGMQFHLTEFELQRRGDRWRVMVEEKWGSNQGRLRTEGRNETEGRGDTSEEACEAVRKDIFAWCDDNEQQRADYATALRKLCYAAEDAAEETEDVTD